MSKWYGKVGYAIPTKTRPGIVEHNTVERYYYGDIITTNRRVQSSDKLNDDIVINNEVSIVADPFANDNLDYMRYVEFLGHNWEITNISIQYPRLILSVGGIYNGEESS